MYTIFLIKNLSTDQETAEQLYVCGPAGYEIMLSPANVTRYCTTPNGGDLIRYETYNEHVAAALLLDAGFIANRESDVPVELLAKSKTYVWENSPDDQASGNYEAWAAAGCPEPISICGPAQIFGPGEAEHMTIDEAKNILDEEECK